ncbi:histidine kinase [Reyranella sp.]|uniref:sensor histidine kinase n=1 Tax=Reyranella sp. TaxID=1929291 RepID=UPI0025CFC2BA|nr:histidine kinase [Reyranella sp.]
MTATVFSRTAGAARTRWNGVPVFWQAQIVGWGLFAIVDLVNLRLLFHDFPVALRRTTLIVVCLVLISTGMRRIYASRHFGNTLTPRTVAWIALLSVGGGAVVSALVFVVRDLAGWSIPGRTALDEFVFPLTHYSIMLAGWSLCYFWIHAEVAEQAEHKRALRAEAEALRAELEELRLQLDPHFLFNALNGVAEEIPEHPDAALAMLRDLTAYLRHSLDGIKQTVVTVEAEVGGLSAYLRVQQARFGDRLRTRVHIDPAAASRRIASFLLQPLIENAVKYGRRENGLDVGIDIRLVGDALHIEIDNTGSLHDVPKTRQRRSGIGLENVRRRLALHYPGRHQFTLGDRGGGENKVVVKLILEGDPCES